MFPSRDVRSVQMVGSPDGVNCCFLNKASGLYRCNRVGRGNARDSMIRLSLSWYCRPSGGPYSIAGANIGRMQKCMCSFVLTLVMGCGRLISGGSFPGLPSFITSSRFDFAVVRTGKWHKFLHITIHVYNTFSSN